MKKICIVTMRGDASRLLERLTFAECVEITNTAADIGVKRNLSHRISYARAVKETLVSEMNSVKEYRAAPRGFFQRKAEYSAQIYDSPDTTVANALFLCDRIAENRRAIEAVDETLRVENLKRSSLIPWTGLDEKLSELDTEHTVTILGSLPIKARLSAIFDAVKEKTEYFSLGEIFCDDKVSKKKYVYAITLRGKEKTVLGTLEGFGFLRYDISEKMGRPTDEKALCDQKISSEIQKREALVLERAELAEQIPLIELALDLIETKIERLLAKEKLIYTKHVALLTGFVPENEIEKVRSAASDIECYIEIEDVTEEDDPPVRLENNAFARPFEPIVEMYSLPKYKSFDPTFIMSIFYFVIFGLMLGDFIYGMLISLACLFMIKKMELGRGTARMIAMFGICGIACSLSGIVFGSYLGDLIGKLYEALTGKPFTVKLGIDLLTSDGIITFVIISLALGAIHLLTGMAISIYVKVKSGDTFSAVFDIGSWYIIFAGLALTFTLKPMAIGGAVAIVGVLMKLLTGGRAKKGFFGKLFGGLLSLYDVVNYAADLVSYMRIMALGLSGGVIASVVNIMATTMISPSGGKMVIGIIVMIPILLIGHIFNIALNLLGCFVHTSRLQYIEFFGKFFEDGGRPFSPLAPRNTYTKISKEK